MSDAARLNPWQRLEQAKAQPKGVMESKDKPFPTERLLRLHQQHRGRVPAFIAELNRPFEQRTAYEATLVTIEQWRQYAHDLHKDIARQQARIAQLEGDLTIANDQLDPQDGRSAIWTESRRSLLLLTFCEMHERIRKVSGKPPTDVAVLREILNDRPKWLPIIEIGNLAKRFNEAKRHYVPLVEEMLAMK